MLSVPCRYLWYFRRYERRGTKARSPRSARSTAPWERRRRLTSIVEINFEVWRKHFTSRYYFKKFRNFWAIRSWKLGEKKHVFGGLGARGASEGVDTYFEGTSPSPNGTFLFPVLCRKFWYFLSYAFPKNRPKHWKSESLKVWKSEIGNVVRFEKKNFLVFLGPNGVQIRKKKQKWKFWKVRTIPPPGSAQQGPRADALGNMIFSCFLESIQYVCTRHGKKNTPSAFSNIWKTESRITKRFFHGFVSKFVIQRCKIFENPSTGSEVMAV